MADREDSVSSATGPAAIQPADVQLFHACWYFAIQGPGPADHESVFWVSGQGHLHAVQFRRIYVLPFIQGE
jgi:hypothetical protein